MDDNEEVVPPDDSQGLPAVIVKYTADECKGPTTRDGGQSSWCKLLFVILSLLISYLYHSYKGCMCCLMLLQVVLAIFSELFLAKLQSNPDKEEENGSNCQNLSVTYPGNIPNPPNQKEAVVDLDQHENADTSDQGVSDGIIGSSALGKPNKHQTTSNSLRIQLQLEATSSESSSSSIIDERSGTFSVNKKKRSTKESGKNRMKQNRKSVTSNADERGGVEDEEGTDKALLAVLQNVTLWDRARQRTHFESLWRNYGCIFTSAVEQGTEWLSLLDIFGPDSDYQPQVFAFLLSDYSNDDLTDRSDGMQLLAFRRQYIDFMINEASQGEAGAEDDVANSGD